MSSHDAILHGSSSYPKTSTRAPVWRLQSALKHTSAPSLSKTSSCTSQRRVTRERLLPPVSPPPQRRTIRERLLLPPVSPPRQRRVIRQRLLPPVSSSRHQPPRPLPPAHASPTSFHPDQASPVHSYSAN